LIRRRLCKVASVYLLFNKGSFAEIAKTRAAFEAADVPVTKAEIETRRAMDRALQYGESVIEFEPDGESARLA